MTKQPLITPDGRYIVVRGRLWRRASPSLSDAERQHLVAELMQARRSVAAARRTGDSEAPAHAAVNAAKMALGERGPVWWTDGAPDLNRHMVRNTPYAAWFANLDACADHATGNSTSLPEVGAKDIRQDGRRSQ